MMQLATNSKTKLFYASNFESLFNELDKSNKYKIIQKEQLSEKPLINWKYLLMLLIFSLGIEWLLRKYKGLI
jgi:hypothetical protein